MITFWYQFIDRSWFLLAVVMLVIVSLCSLYYVLVVPESPKWFYTWNQYDEAREVLGEVSRFNAVEQSQQEVIKAIKFDTELMKRDEVVSLCSVITYKMEDSTYFFNLAIVSMMWTAASFSYYMLQFMTKYYEGSIYLNFYLGGVAGCIGNTVAQPIYNCLKIRLSFIVSLSIIIFLSLWFMALQENYVSAYWITWLGAPESGFEKGTREDQEVHLKILIPALAFIIKVFINIVFVSAYQCSLNEDIIFPFFKRVTSVGICNFISRFFTIFAPLVAELPRPQPMIFLLVLNSISLILAFFLPSREEETVFE